MTTAGAGAGASGAGDGPATRPRPAARLVLLLAALGLLALVLQLLAVTRQSFIGDAAYHLTAGHQALRWGVNTLNLEHPPLVKMVAAAPLLSEEPLAPPASVDRALAVSKRLWDDPARARRVRLRSRLLLLAAFGLPFLGTSFLLGRRLHGPLAGAVLALALALSFAVLPYLAVVQTDAAVALGVVATALAGLRFLAAPGWRAAALVGAAWGLAMAGKHSGLLLLPAVAALPWLVGQRHRKRLGQLALAAAVAGLVVWSTYALANRRYDAASGRDAIGRYTAGQALLVDDRLRSWRAPLLDLEEISPELAQWATGVLGIGAQNAIGVYPTYALGRVSTEGRWWYFPVVLLVRTPLALLVASALAIAAAVRARRRPRPAPPAVFLGLLVGVYLVAALGSSYNLGIRHLLPVLPFLYLPAAAWAALRPRRVAVLLLALGLEAALLSPRWMTATATWWIGDEDPLQRAVLAGDMVYHQELAELGRVARRRGLAPLHVFYPQLSPAELAVDVPEARLLAPPLAGLPAGWYAVSLLLERYVPALARTPVDELRDGEALRALADSWRPALSAVQAGEDLGRVAGAFRLYRLPVPTPIAPGGTHEGDRPPPR